MKLEISIDKKKFLRFLSIVAGIIIFFVLFSGSSKAESGTITVIDTTIQSYTINDGSGAATSASNQIYWDTSNYNNIQSFHINLSLQTPTFALDSESTEFTCNPPDTCGGYAWYVKETQKVYWAFTSGSVTTSPINLVYTKNIMANITSTDRLKSDCTPSMTQPVLVYKEFSVTNRCLAGFYESVTTDSRTTDSYTVTYPFADAFTINVTKGKAINDRWVIMDANSVPYMTGTMDKLDFVFTNASYNGIIVNVSIASGAHTIETINLTGTPGFVTPIVQTVDPLTGVGITFDADSYNIGATANISWIKNNPTPFGYQDDIYLIQPTTTGSTVKKILVSSPQDTGFIKTNDFPIAGKYNVTFERSILGLFPELLASDTATISAEQASYILVNETVPVGVYISGTYLAGWNGVGRIVIYQDMPDGTVKEIDSLAINGTCCIEFTVSQLFFPEAGNYRVVLMKGYDTVRAASSVVAYFTDIIPGANITVSNISLNKNQYTYGEHYTITYQVDDVNYSNKAKRIIAYEVATGANTLVNQVPTQTGTITRTFDSEMYPFSGALQLRLMGLNATGDYLLAYVNFTLSKIDTEGYGLDVTKSTICTKETGYFTYYSPGPVNIQISDKDVTVYSRNFSSAVSGKTVPFTINRVGNYEIFLRVSNGTDVKFTKIVEVKACEAATTPGFPGQNGTWTPKQDSIAPTCNFWDGWVQLIFGVQGVNDVTRFQFALILIVVPMVVVVIITKSVGSGIAVGFIPYTFFAFLSLSTPCGTYMPTWTVIFIALVIGIKMRWFS